MVATRVAASLKLLLFRKPPPLAKKETHQRDKRLGNQDQPAEGGGRLFQEFQEAVGKDKHRHAEQEHTSDIPTPNKTFAKSDKPGKKEYRCQKRT